MPASHALPRGFWRMQRHAHSEGNARLVSTLEDAPFCSALVVEAQIGGERVTAQQGLSLTKFMPLIRRACPPAAYPLAG
ncbi:MAG: hypothetical protein U1F47_02295 [Hyphomicrobiales bacterium]